MSLTAILAIVFSVVMLLIVISAAGSDTKKNVIIEADRVGKKGRRGRKGVDEDSSNGISVSLDRHHPKEPWGGA